nr:hypothetical protein [Wolbachia endosymbiont (group B) of Episyrphus balteatus]
MCLYGTLNSEDITPAPSSAVRPSSFINSVFSWMGTSTTAALSSLFQSAPALPPAQQSAVHSAESSIDFSRGNLYGTAMLGYVMFKQFTGKKYSEPLNNSLFAIEGIREKEFHTMAKNVETALSKCEKLYQCPRSSLSNSTISKGVCHQKSL